MALAEASSARRKAGRARRMTSPVWGRGRATILAVPRKTSSEYFGLAVQIAVAFPEGPRLECARVVGRARGCKGAQGPALGSLGLSDDRNEQRGAAFGHPQSPELGERAAACRSVAYARRYT